MLPSCVCLKHNAKRSCVYTVYAFYVCMLSRVLSSLAVVSDTVPTCSSYLLCHLRVSECVCLMCCVWWDMVNCSYQYTSSVHIGIDRCNWYASYLRFLLASSVNSYLLVLSFCVCLKHNASKRCVYAVFMLLVFVCCRGSWTVCYLCYLCLIRFLLASPTCLVCVLYLFVLSSGRFET